MPDLANTNATRTPTILMVEDDDDHADLIRRCLTSADPRIAIRHAVDAESALRHLHNRTDPDTPKPDLILVDLKLPGPSGHTVIHSIKTDRRLRAIPTVVLTTSYSEDDRSRAYDAGANSYLVKPIDIEEMRDMLADLLRYWTAWNHPA